MRNKKKMVLVSLAIVVVFSLWQWLKPYPPQVTLTEQEHNVVDNLLANPTPRCIGRYLVDLPEDFNIPIGTVYINKKEIEFKRLYLPAFEQHIRLREEELRNEKPLDTVDAPFLKNIYPLPNGMKGVIFETNSSNVAPDVFRKLEVHIYSNGVAFKTELSVKNPDSARYQKERDNDPDYYKNNTQEKLNELNKLLTRLHGRQENEIPTEKGFCFPNGFISGVSGVNDEMEDVRFSYRSKINPLLYIEFSTDNYLHEETSMLERSSTISSGLLNIQTTTLMKGRREINKLAAEEWLVVGNGEDSRSGHTFVLNVNEKIGSPQTPMFSIELNHGPLPDETLSQDAVVAFWQKITETLRVRPGAI
ncbi:T6SS immunity protein Tli4 family protein [Yersinia intermedia]|uniref:T6SS immunity protein Tli4 family protein n=1 Tax=Yersinia intermedia TaxID=631 RepID=UPI0011A9EEC7|nr:T6SS immunity protein Tli4 family protein [Yersinia intermedia]